MFKNGEYLLDPAEGLAFEFRPRKDGVDYEVAIPLERLRPFSPFIYEKVALNLVYADKDGGGGATPVMIHPDANYDTERSAMRAGEFFALKTVSPKNRAGRQLSRRPGEELLPGRRDDRRALRGQRCKETGQRESQRGDDGRGSGRATG